MVLIGTAGLTWRGIVASASVLNVAEVVVDPVGELRDQPGCTGPEGGQPVVHDYRPILAPGRALDEAITPEILQGAGQHFVADPAEGLSQFTEAARPIEQRDQHQHPPSACHVLEDGTRGTVRCVQVPALPGLIQPSGQKGRGVRFVAHEGELTSKLAAHGPRRTARLLPWESDINDYPEG